VKGGGGAKLASAELHYLARAAWLHDVGIGSTRSVSAFEDDVLDRSSMVELTLAGITLEKTFTIEMARWRFLVVDLSRGL
jgi:hypothetical protein